jgi:hypothetical protein
VKKRCRASCCIYASMAKTASMRPPKESVLAAAEPCAGALPEGEGLLPLPLPLEEVGEPVETVPLEVPVGTETVVLPPVGRGTTAVVPSGAVTTPVVEAPGVLLARVSLRG